MGSRKSKEAQIKNLDEDATNIRRDLIQRTLIASTGAFVGFLGWRGESNLRTAEAYAQEYLKDDLAKNQVLDKIVFNLAKSGLVATFLSSILAGIDGTYYAKNRLLRRKLLLPLSGRTK